MKTTMITWLKLFTIFIITTLFTSHLYGVDINLDGTIAKVIGDNLDDETTCKAGDYYKLTNTTLYNGDTPFDILLHVVKEENEADELTEDTNYHRNRCIGLTSTDKYANTGALIEILIRALNRNPNDTNVTNTRAYMDIEFIPIRKTENENINENSLNNLRLNIDNLAFTAFDLDLASSLSGTDDVYIASPGEAYDDPNHVSQVTIISGDDDSNFSNNHYILGRGINGECDDEAGSADLTCRLSGTMRINHAQPKFLLRLYNSNAYGAGPLAEMHDTEEYRLFQLSLSGAYIPGQDHGDLPTTYGDAYHKIDKDQLFMGAEIDEEEISLKSKFVGIYNEGFGDDSVYKDKYGMDHIDDEDAVNIVGSDEENLTMTEGYDTNFSIITKGHGYLSVWADYNGDENFAGEQILTDYEVNSVDSVQNYIGLTIPNIDSNETRDTYIRFRLSTEQNIASYGNGAIGEVEDYVLRILPSGRVTGTVYNDINGNAQRDEGEEGFPNVHVTVTAQNGETQVVLTDANGSYRVEHVAEGTANVTVTESDLPVGAIATNGITNPTSVEVIAHQDNFEEDNGYLLLASVHGTIYNDKNGNGIQNIDEPGFPNIHVSVTSENNETQVTITNENGEYRVENVTIGTATVDINESELGGAIKTVNTTNPTLVNVEGGQDNFEENNGYKLLANLITNKTVDNTTPLVNDTVTYTITVTNNGPADATNVTLVDHLPEGVQFIRYIANGTYDTNSGIWNVGTINNGQTETLQIVTNVDKLVAGEEITNEVSAASTDDQEDNATEEDNLTAVIAVREYPTVTISNARAIEGESLVFDLNLSHESNDYIVVGVKTQNDTAISEKDYNGITNWVIFAPHTTSETFTVTTIDDSIHEALEENMELVGEVLTFDTTLNTSVIGTGTIEDNDVNITVSSLNNATVEEGQNLVHTVEVSQSDLNQTYDFNIVDDSTDSEDYTMPPTFSEGVEYDATTGQITVPAGVTTFTVTVETIEDGIYEGSESYTITVGDKEATGTMVDGDEPIVSITPSNDNANVIEGNDLIFEVNLSEASTEDIVIDLNTQNGTAEAGSDYNSTTQTVIIEAGTLGTLFVVPTIDDIRVERPEETINIEGTVTSGTVANQELEGVGIIVDNDEQSVSSLNNATVEEGQNLVHTVEVSQSDLNQTYDFNIVDDSTDSEDYTMPPTFSEGVEYDATTGQITVPAGVTTFTVTVETIEDGIYEGSESYTITVGDKEATGTMVDGDEPIVSITPSNDNANVIEGNDLIFEVNLSEASTEDIVIDLNTQNGTAEAGSDYNSTTQTVIIEAGTLGTLFVVPTIDDIRVERPEETINIEGTVTSGTVANQELEGVGIIVDNDEQSVSSLNNATVEEGQNLVHTVEVSQSDLNQTYDFNIVDDSTDSEDYTMPPTFSEGVEYDATTGQITVPAGVTTFTVTVETIEDGIYEGSESYTITVGDKEATGTMVDGDEPIVSITPSNDNANVIEGNDLIFEVNLSEASTEDIVIDLNTQNGTAEAGSDYNSTTQTVIIEAGTLGTLFVVPTIDDIRVERPEETINIEGTVTSGTVANQELEGVGIIVDNDEQSVSSLNNATVAEGQNLVHTVEVSQSDLNQTYDFNIVDDSTDSEDYTMPPTFSEGVEYDATTGQITVPAGVTTFTVTVETIEDGIYEGSESYTITVGDKEATGTMVDGDEPIVSITPSNDNANVIEGNDLIFEVNLSEASTEDIVIDLNTQNGTAEAGSDYNSTTQTVIIEAGTLGTLFVVPTIDDIRVERPEETINIEGTVTSGTVANQELEGVGIIVDNDEQSVSSLNNATVEEGQNLVHTVEVSQSDLNQTYDFNIVDDSTDSEDYTMPPTFSEGVEYDATTGQITVPAGVTTFTVTVETIEDGIYEGSESYTITVGDKEATGTMVDADEIKVESVSTVIVKEGKDLNHTVKLTGIANEAITYDYNITDYSTSSDDYEAPVFTNGVTDNKDGTITVPAGVDTFIVRIHANKDLIDGEGIEEYNLYIGNDGINGIGKIINVRP